MWSFLKQRSSSLFDNDTRFEGVPFWRAAGVLSLEKYARQDGVSLDTVLLLRHIADVHSAPPLSSSEWARLHESLRIVEPLIRRRQDEDASKDERSGKPRSSS